MPTYEYKCSNCQNFLEAFQKMTDPVLTECPGCHQNTLNKLVSAAGFQLKGSGWYVTDYSKKSQPPKNEQAASETKTEGTTETKPETKDTSKNSTDQTGTGKSGAGE